MKHKPHETDKTAVVALVDTFKDATGIQLVKEGMKWIATGAFMGTSDAIPGYSGGTTLALLGFFRKLIMVAKSIFIPEPGITRTKAILFFIPFACGWIAGVFGFAKLTEMLADHGLGLELMFFFSPFIIFTIPVFLKSEKPNLTKGKKILKTHRWLWFAAGFIIILAVGLYTILADKGIKMGVESGDTIFQLGQNLNWLKLIGVGFLAGMVSLIPGGSGALIQMLTDMYPAIHWTIMAHAEHNIGGLFIFAFSTLAGMLSMVFIMAWGLKKHKNKLAALSLGMLIASTITLFLVPNTSMWREIADVKHYIGIPVAILLGSGAGLSLNIWVHYKHRKKLRSKIAKA